MWTSFIFKLVIGNGGKNPTKIWAHAQLNLADESKTKISRLSSVQCAWSICDVEIKAMLYSGTSRKYPRLCLYCVQKCPLDTALTLCALRACLWDAFVLTQSCTFGVVSTFSDPKSAGQRDERSVAHMGGEGCVTLFVCVCHWKYIVFLFLHFYDEKKNLLKVN